jgi:hypothetical protein
LIVEDRELQPLPFRFSKLFQAFETRIRLTIDLGLQALIPTFGFTSRGLLSGMFEVVEERHQLCPTLIVLRVWYFFSALVHQSPAAFQACLAIDTDKDRKQLFKEGVVDTTCPIRPFTDTVSPT